MNKDLGSKQLMSVVTRLNSLREAGMISFIQITCCSEKWLLFRYLSLFWILQRKVWDSEKKYSDGVSLKLHFNNWRSHCIPVWNLKCQATSFVQGGNQSHVFTILSKWSICGCHGYVPVKQHPEVFLNVNLPYTEAGIHCGPNLAVCISHFSHRPF